MKKVLLLTAAMCLSNYPAHAAHYADGREYVYPGGSQKGKRVDPIQLPPAPPVHFPPGYGGAKGSKVIPK